MTTPIKQAASAAIKSMMHKETQIQTTAKALSTARTLNSKPVSAFSENARQLHTNRLSAKATQPPMPHQMGSKLNNPNTMAKATMSKQLAGAGRTFSSQPPTGKDLDSFYDAALLAATSNGTGLIEITTPDQQSIVSHTRLKMAQSFKEPNIQLANGYTVLAVVAADPQTHSSPLNNVRNTDMSHYRLLVAPPSTDGVSSGPETIPVTVVVSEHAKTSDTNVLVGLASRASRVHREITKGDAANTPSVICQNEPDLQNLINNRMNASGQSVAGIARQMITIGGASFKVKTASIDPGNAETLIVRRPILFGRTPDVINPNLQSAYLPTGQQGFDAVNAYLQCTAVPTSELANQLVARAGLEPEETVVQMPNPVQGRQALNAVQTTTLLNSLLETKGQDPQWQAHPREVELRDITHKGGAMRAAMKLNAYAHGGANAHMPTICVTPDPGKPGQQSFFAIFSDKQGNWVEQTTASNVGPQAGQLFADSDKLAQTLKDRGVTQIISRPLGWL